MCGCSSPKVLVGPLATCLVFLSVALHRPGPDFVVSRFHGTCMSIGCRKVVEDEEYSDETIVELFEEFACIFIWVFRSALFDILN